MKAGMGDTISLRYWVALENWLVFDSSNGTPVRLTLGKSKILKAVENALIGMEPGDEAELFLSPDEAYGRYKPRLLRTYPIEYFWGMRIKPGMALVTTTLDGRLVDVHVKKVRKNAVIIDFNHRLAGKQLHIWLKLEGLFGKEMPSLARMIEST